MDFGDTMNAQSSPILAAERLYAHLSPGSRFFRSERGYHRAFDPVLVPTGDTLRYAVAVYFTDDDGADAHAFVNRALFDRVPELSPTAFLAWSQPISYRAFVPAGDNRSLGNILRLTRVWIREQARCGWHLPLPGKFRGLTAMWSFAIASL